MSVWDWVKAAGLVLGGLVVGVLLGILLLYLALVAAHNPPV